MGGRDMGVVSMVLTLGWGWVCGVRLLVPPRGYCSRRVFFVSRVPLCVRDFGAFGFLWEREQVCDNVKRCKGG